jgi:hypothetical protein
MGTARVIRSRDGERGAVPIDAEIVFDPDPPLAWDRAAGYSEVSWKDEKKRSTSAGAGSAFFIVAISWYNRPSTW